MADQSPTWIKHLSGQFIVFDGPDRSGKTTQINRFARHVQAAGVPVCQVRDPGSTDIGEAIRKILLHADGVQPMDAVCEMLLFMASRAQLLARSIKPALARCQLVLSDRFVSSTLAYQGMAAGLPAEQIRQVADIVLGSCWPDLVVIFDIDQATARKRGAGSQDPDRDRIESRGARFHRLVRRGFLEQARTRPASQLVLDARADQDVVFGRLISAMEARYAQASPNGSSQ